MSLKDGFCVMLIEQVAKPPETIQIWLWQDLGRYYSATQQPGK
ncbi:MAG: hypothetical protein WBA93_05415 [Microcoleaceae cyanobacterium]